ncbi:histidine phosphatase family protein [Rhodocyclus tenuis]|uniref:Histidine phosphatase family protein n=2 Tax=Rhodocyclus TaxID=1064 RepID=A0A6L5JYT8_RHOTE|nr:histidine phosphatase family protein [Rhodocyclus gracilis]MQY51750.1 histidine phosphatase family protein [Rhodocyclus gracilis]NJA88989.1 histidine phosphatase family protein [Rhodocyclus gracilis]
MDLLLWRHADAEDGLPDLQRPLTARGEAQAQQMADWLHAHAPKRLAVLVSPAVRAQQTAAALKQPFVTDERLRPGADVCELLAATGWADGDEMDDSDDGSTTTAVRHSPTHARRAVLVVGHQPTLGRVAALLLGGQEADWSVKKGSVWWFSNRVRRGETQTVLRAVIGPDYLP